jgi:hypothetical protein
MSAAINDYLYYTEMLDVYKRHLDGLDNPNYDVSYFETDEFQEDLIKMKSWGMLK